MVIASLESGCDGALAGAFVAAIMVIESAPAAVSAVATRAFIFGLMKRSTSLRSSSSAYGVSCRARGGHPGIGTVRTAGATRASTRDSPQAGAAPEAPHLQWVPRSPSHRATATR